MRKKISYTLLLLGCCSALLLMSFREDPEEGIQSIDQLIEYTIQKKLDTYRATREKRCRDKLFREAGKKADSLIIATAKSLKVIQDTLDRPDAPDRPDKPVLLEPIDSSFPTPILSEDSLQFDSIISGQ